VSTKSLTWGLVIATYKRAYILPHCIKLAAGQSRQPQEIIVIDASPDWQTTRDRIVADIGESSPSIRLYYVKAARPSITAQRNQGIDLATSDILFFFDDDTLMNADCAEEIMAIYEADTAQSIVGIQAVLDVTIPEEVATSSYADIRYKGVVDGSFGASSNPIVRLGHRLLAAEDYIVKYEEVDHPIQIPLSLQRMRVALTDVLAGMRMTFRRAVIRETRFEDLLERYAAYEDYDASLRASRYGLLLTALRARVCHLKSGGGRLSRRKTTYLSSLNWAVLLRLNSSDPQRARRIYKRKLVKSAIVDLLRDVVRNRWDLPHFRGRIAGLMMINSVFDRNPQELRKWYKNYQGIMFKE
jgi:GT2 family glycosyltransferase